MGLLRLFLALSVLSSHVSGLEPRIPLGGVAIWPHPFVAVCCFFIVSGFYMAMVLDERYRGAVPQFYVNRLVRLLPVWWAVCAFQVIGNELGWLVDVPGINAVRTFMQPSVHAPFEPRAIVVLANVLLLPAGIKGPFPPATPWTALISGQMYTVALEMVFYIFAPLIVRLRAVPFAALTVAAAIAHFLPPWLGLPPRPWQYEFFPGVLVFFLLGMGSYRLRGYVCCGPVWIGWMALPLIGAYCWEFYAELSQAFTNTWQPWTLYLALPILIPLLFRASRHSAVDRFVGDLSYPLYVCHFVVIAWTFDRHLGSQITAVIAIGVAIVLTLAIERPMQRVRVAVRRPARQAMVAA